MSSPNGPTAAERGENGRVYESVAAAAHAYAADQLDDDGFVAALVRLPIVRQSPMPDREWFDDWPLIDGPLSDLQDALNQRLITAGLYDAALTAMIAGGHDG
jgi:hypothetical protein